MKNALPFFLLIFSIFFGCQKMAKQELEGKISGAYQALNALSDQRAYPSSDIPSKSYFPAWEKAAEMKLQTRSNTPEPWEAIGPHNRGGRTLTIAFNPLNADIMYAGSASGGLWRTRTAGIGETAWERVETGYPVLGVGCIAFPANDSMTMYIGTGEVYNFYEAGTGAAYRSTRGSFGMGILKSTDAGQTWEPSLDWSYEEQRGIWAVEVDPSNANIVWANTTHGVYKSTDAGATWNQVLDVMMGNDLIIHPNDPDLILASFGNFGTAGKGIYRTTNGGVSWNQIGSNLNTTFLGKIQLDFHKANPDIVYASFGNGFGFDDGATWLYRSDNFGLSWVLKSQTDYSMWQGWFAHDVAVHPSNPDKITCVGITAWQSNNAGSDLANITSGGTGFSNPPIAGPDGPPTYIHSDAHDVIYHPTNPAIIYVASDGGIHRSDDDGANWYSCNGAYQTVQFYNGFSSSDQDSTFSMGGLQDNGTIVWNGDLTWRRVYGGDGAWSAITPIQDDTIYYCSQYLNLRRSFNQGMNSNGISPPDGNTVFIAPFKLSPSNPNTIWAGRDILYRSNNLGEFWQATNAGNPLNGDPILSLAVSYQTSNIVYAATAPGTFAPQVFVTINGGSTYTNITHDLPNRYPMDMIVDPNDDATAYICFSGFGTGHVYKTTDRGDTWTDISTDLPDVPTNTVVVDPMNSDFIYVGNDLGVYVSTDGGLTWYDYNDGLPSATMVFDLSISASNRKLRVASHGVGVYQRDLLEEPITVATTAPKKFEDWTLFPNPVVESTTQLSLHWNSDAPATIDLLDLTGQLVQVVFQGQLPSGKNTITIHTQGLKAGLYFVRLRGNNTFGILKLIKT